MTQPARQHHQAQIFATQKKQLWVVLLLILASGAVGAVFGQAHLTAKSVAAGAMLAFVAQSAFTLIAYRLTGAKARQAIMLNMYLGQMIKWVITLLGFALIFKMALPIHTMLVFLGYVAMLVAHVVMMWRINT